MNLRAKGLWLVAVGALAFSASATAAVADPEVNPEPPHHERGEHDELHERYGELEQVNLPPLVVKEQKTAPKLPVKEEVATTLTDATVVDPVANVPIDPKQINPQSSTPADTFFQSASIGLGAMGVGAASLGVVAIRRSIRLRKDPKADFLYQ